MPSLSSPSGAAKLPPPNSNRRRRAWPWKSGTSTSRSSVYAMAQGGVGNADGLGQLLALQAATFLPLPYVGRSYKRYAMPDCAGEAIPCQAASGRIQLAMDETYVKVKGVWKYLYRAVDKAGATVDFLLTAKRDRKAALAFPSQGDRAERHAREDHDRQERCQYGDDRESQRDRRLASRSARSNTSTTSLSRIIGPSSD